MVNSESMDSSGDGKPKDYVVTQLNSGGGSISVDTHSPSPVTASSVRLRDAMMDYDANETATDVTSSAECATNPTVDSLPETAVTRTIVNENENIRLTTTATDILQQCESNQSSLYCSVPLVKIQDVLSSYSVDSSGDEINKVNKKLVPRKFLCLYCDRTFVTSNLRQKHVDRCHSVKQARRSSARFQPKFSTACIFCKKLNNTDHNLDDLFKHLVERHSNKYFACVPCEERFLFKSHLEEHNVQNHPKKEKKKVEEVSKFNDVVSDVIPDETVEISTIKTKHKTKIKKDESTGRGEDSNRPNLRMGVRKELRKKKIGVKSTKTGVKRNTRLQTKVTNAQSKSVSCTSSSSTRRARNIKTRHEKVTETVEKPSGCINPYPTFDAFFRVKKITDHSIDNLKISHLTFDDVFDKAFYTRIKCNIQENLQNHIDGKLFKNEESESRISNFEKNQEVNSSLAENFGCDISLNAATPVVSLLSSQLGEDLESQIEYGAKASKKKPPPKKDEVHYKYFTRRKYQASILENKENRDLSKLDMWTQLVVKDRQQQIINDKKTDKEKIEYTKGIEYRTKMQNAELNRILDRRGPFEDLREEANKKAAFDKYHKLGENVNCEAISDVTSILNDLIDQVFDYRDHTVKIEDEPIDKKPQIPDSECEIPFYLNLRRNSSLIDQPDIDRSDRITLICSSQETENFEETVSPRDKNSLVELTGEWTRTRIYICAACGVKVPNIKLLIDHKSVYHQNVWVQHYEFVGNQSVLYKHLSIPILGKVGYFEKYPMPKTWRRSDARLCTKCAKMCNSLGELHRHILECGEDWSWMLARRKLKYRPFGTKSRRKRRGLVKRIIHKEKSGDEVREKKKYNIKRYEKPSDAETIQRMLANLPAKRATRKLICLKDGFPKQRKPKQNPNNTSINSPKLSKVGRKKSSISNLTKQALNTSSPKKRGRKCNPMILRKSLRNINKVFGTKILDSNSTLLVKRKLKNVLQHQRITRARKMLIEETTNDKKEETPSDTGKKEGLLNKMKMLTKAVKKTVLKKDENKIESSSNKTSKIKNLKQSDSIEDKINDIMNSIDEGDNNISDNKKEITKNKAEEVEETSNSIVSKKKPKLMKKESISSKLVRTLSLRKMRKKNTEEEKLKTQSNPELDAKIPDDKVKNGKRKSTLDSFKNKIKKIKLKDRNVPQIVQVDGSSQISDEILPFLEKIHINSDEITDKVKEIDENSEKESNSIPSTSTEVTETTEIQKLESEVENLENSEENIIDPIKSSSPITESATQTVENCSTNINENNPSTSTNMEEEQETILDNHSKSEATNINSELVESFQIENQAIKIENISQEQSEISTDSKLSSSFSLKSKGKKRSKGLNDCIAMLTSKLKQKVDEEPPIVSLPNSRPENVQNISVNEKITEKEKPKQIDENIVKPQVINQIPHPEILLQPKLAELNHKIFKANLEKLEKERQEAINLQTRYFLEQQQLFLQQLQMQLPIAPIANPYAYIPNIPKEASFLINNIMLSNQKELGEKFLQNEENLSKFLGNFDKNKFKEVDVNIEIDIMKCLGGVPENRVPKNDKSKSRNDNKKRQSNKIATSKRTNKKKENIDLINDEQNIKINERLAENFSSTNMITPEKTDLKLKSSELIKDTDNVIDLKINKRPEELRIPGESVNNHFIPNLNASQPIQFLNTSNQDVIDLKIKRNIDKEKNLLEELSKNGLSISLFPTNDTKGCEVFNKANLDLQIKKVDTQNHHPNIKNLLSSSSVQFGSIPKVGNALYDNEVAIDLIMNKRSDKVGVAEENGTKISEDKLINVTSVHFVNERDVQLPKPANNDSNLLQTEVKVPKRPGRKKKVQKIAKGTNQNVTKIESLETNKNAVLPTNENDKIIDLKINKENAKTFIPDIKLFGKLEEVPKVSIISPKPMVIAETKISKKSQKKKNSKSQNQYPQIEEVKLNKFNIANILEKEKSISKKVILKPPQFIPSNILRPPILDLQNLKIPISTEILNVPSQETILPNKMIKQDGDKMKNSNQPDFKIKPLFVEEREPDVLEEKTIEKPCFVKLDSVKVGSVKEIDDKSVGEVKNLAEIPSVPSPKSDTDSEDDVPLAKLVQPPKIPEAIVEEDNPKCLEKELDITEEVSKDIPKECTLQENIVDVAVKVVKNQKQIQVNLKTKQVKAKDIIKQLKSKTKEVKKKEKSKNVQKLSNSSEIKKLELNLPEIQSKLKPNSKEIQNQFESNLQEIQKQSEQEVQKQLDSGPLELESESQKILKPFEPNSEIKKHLQLSLQEVQDQLIFNSEETQRQIKIIPKDSQQFQQNSKEIHGQNQPDPKELQKEPESISEGMPKQFDFILKEAQKFYPNLEDTRMPLLPIQEEIQKHSQIMDRAQKDTHQYCRHEAQNQPNVNSNEAQKEIERNIKDAQIEILSNQVKNQILFLLPVVPRDDIQTNPDMLNKVTETEEAVKTNKNKIRVRKRTDEKKEKPKKIPKSKVPPLLEECVGENGTKTARKIKISCQIFQKSSKIVLDTSKILNEVENEEEEEEKQQEAIPVINNVIIKQEQTTEPIEDVELPPENSIELVQEISPFDNPIAPIEKEPAELSEESKKVESVEPKLLRIKQELPEIEDPQSELAQETHEEFFETPPVEEVPPTSEVEPENCSPSATDLELEIRRRIKLSNLILKREETEDTLTPLPFSTDIVYSVDSPKISYEPEGENIPKMYQNVTNNEENYCLNIAEENKLVDSVDDGNNLENPLENNLEDNNINLLENKMSESTYNIKINTVQNETFNPEVETAIDTEITTQIGAVNADSKLNEQITTNLKEINQLDKQGEDDNRDFQNAKEGNLPTETANVTPNVKILEEHKQIAPKDVEIKPKKSKKKHEDKMDIPATYGEFQVNAEQTGTINKLKISRKKLPVNCNTNEGGISGDQTKSIDIYVVKKIKKNHKKSLANKERKRKKSSGSLKENQNDVPVDIENRNDLERSSNFLDNNFDPIADSLLENVEFEVQNEEIGRKLKINKKKIKEKESPMTVTTEIVAPPMAIFAEISAPSNTVNAIITPSMTVNAEISAPPMVYNSEVAATSLNISSNLENEKLVDNTEIVNTEIANTNEQITDQIENIELHGVDAIKDYDDLPKDMEIEDFEVDRPIIETQFHTLPLSSVRTHTLTNVTLEPVITCSKTTKKGKKRSKNNLYEDTQTLEEDELPLSSILAFNNSGLKDFGKITSENVHTEKYDFQNESGNYQNEPNIFSINNYLEVKNPFYQIDHTSNTNDLFSKTGSIISNIRSNISTPNTDFILGNSSSSNSLRKGRLSKNKDLISSFNFDQIDVTTSNNVDVHKDDFNEVNVNLKSTEINFEISEDAILAGTNLKKKKLKISKDTSTTNYENEIDINILGDKEVNHKGIDVTNLELETQNSLDKVVNTNKISKKRGKKSKDLEHYKDSKMNIEVDAEIIKPEIEIPENAFGFTSTPVGDDKKSKDFKNKDEKVESQLIHKENFETDEVDAIIPITDIEISTLEDRNLCLNESPFRKSNKCKDFTLTESKLILNEEINNKIGVTETSTKDVYDFCDETELEMTVLNSSKVGKEVNDSKDEDLKVSSKKPRKKNKNIKSPAITPDLKLIDVETNSSLNSLDLGDSKPKKQKKSKNTKSKNEPSATTSSTFDTICDELQALCDVPLELTPVHKEIDTTTEINTEFNLTDETVLNKSDITFCDNVKTSCDAKIDELLKEITFSPKTSKKSKKGKIVPPPKALENEDIILDAKETPPDNTSNLDNQIISCFQENMDKKVDELIDNEVISNVVHTENNEENNIARFEGPGQEQNEKFEPPAPPVKSKAPRSRSPKKKMAKGKKERAPSNENIESYCDICDKMFARSENLIKHKRTLTHIAKLSEIEAKEALAKTEHEKIEEIEKEQFKMDINISNILNTDKQCEQEISEDLTNKSHINSPFVLNTNSDTLKLADIINDVLNKPVENDKHNPSYTTDSQMSSQTPNSITKSETKRYKSLGERKSFESDLKTTPTPSYQFNKIQINNSDTIPTLPNPDTILKHQISILENIIETEGPFGYIDDISVSSNKSVEEPMPKSPSELSIMSEANKQDDSNQLTFTHNTNMMSTLVKPSIHNEQFIKPTQYEEISNDSSTVRNQFDDQRSRKVLNRDEELFLECCSLLKSSSEVSAYSKRSSKTVHILNNFEMKQSDEPDWLERKNFATKSQEFRQDIFSTSCPNTPLGDGYAEDYSNTNSNTIATDWSTKQREQQQQENPVFEDISLDSKGSMISKQEMDQFKNVDRNFGDFQLFNTDRKNESKEDGELKTGEDFNDKEVDEDFKKKMVSRFGGLMAKAWKNSMQVVKKNKNKKKQGAEVTQTSITDYAVPLTSGKVDNDTIDSKKMLTKGAMKVFEGLKVSIPTDDLDMKELLNSSHSGKKQEQEINKECLEKPPIPKEIESLKEDEKISKNIKNIGNRLGLKVTKKKPNIKNQEQSLLAAKATPIKDDDSKKGHDIYDFEETQDNSDIFSSKLTNIKEFRSQIAEKKTLTSEVIDNKEPSAIMDNPEESDNESRGGLIDSFGYEAQSLSSFSTESSSSARKPKKKNITKKKCMIMGRIFKNAFKSKIDEDIRDIPLADNSKLVEDYVMHLPPKEEKRPKLTEQEMDMLFDQLLEDRPVDEVDKNVIPNKENPQVVPSNKVEKVNVSKIKTKAPVKRKRVRHNSESTDDEFSLNKNKKRYTKKKQKNVDNAINLEQELKECIGVASRKSQRKCTSGKQNILVEFWSSDDSNFEAFIRETAMDKPNEEIKDIADEVKELEDILDLKKAEEPKNEEPFKEKVDTIKKATPKIEIENQKTANPTTIQEASVLKPERLPNSKQARRKSSNVKHRSKNEEDVDNKKKNVKTTAETLAANRRKRAASNTLYYWSSSSEDESRDLIEIKPVRDEVDEDDEDRPMQHGWIVGDSPKKLVTMLAQAKGKKVDADSVKEQGKKRTTM